MSSSLQGQLDELPKSPGVYLFNDAKKKLLYVGKSRNLRARVRSYFQSGPKSPHIQRMVSEISGLQVIVTETEAEALLLENSFIKNNKPRYNVCLRDDKTYPYIKITDEIFPRVIFTRHKRSDGQYFGPFPSAQAARKSIKLIHQHFKVRSCDLSLGEKSYRPCLQYHIKRCDAPCAFLVTPNLYEEGVKRAALFLAGKTDDLVHEVSNEMQAAAKAQAFERAAYFRDLLGLVNTVSRPQNVTSLSYDRLDVVAMYSEGWEGAVFVMAIRGGAIVRSSHFRVEWEEEPLKDLGRFLTHFYLSHEDPPDELVLAACEDQELLEEVFVTKRGRKLKVSIPLRGTKRRLLDMAEETLRVNLEMSREESHQHPGLVQLADLLDLTAPPKTMECFDISNTMGTYSIASMVHFADGKPDKRNYRKFNIKTVEGPNDFASIAEAVKRRYKRLLEEGAALPDLILIDGGLGQLHAAHESLTALGLGEHPLFSLAKREELVFRVGTSEPIFIPLHEPAIRLLQQMRDEAHRIGITAHRKKRGKAMLESALDGIPGLGPVRVKKLLLHFGSVKRIREASLSQLEALLGKKTAEQVKAHLN